jgi:hypothetical protein
LVLFYYILGVRKNLMPVFPKKHLLERLDMKKFAAALDNPAKRRGYGTKRSVQGLHDMCAEGSKYRGRQNGGGVCGGVK